MDPNLVSFNQGHCYTQEEIAQIAKNTCAQIMIAAQTKDTQFLDAVAPGSRSAGLIKDAMKLSLLPVQQKNDDEDKDCQIDLSFTPQLKDYIDFKTEALEANRKQQQEIFEQEQAAIKEMNKNGQHIGISR